MARLHQRLRPWLELLRWNKPTGRLILLIPAAWTLWLAPTAPPSAGLLLQIVLGGLSVSGAGCVANDLWDRRFDGRVERTNQRPLARGALSVRQALILLLLMLCLSLGVVLSLDASSRQLCLMLAVAAVPPILLYPSAKRWFNFPQAVLAICWGFAVLIPWAAATGEVSADPTLIGCWLATVVWTFGFDTVYAMADRRDDVTIGLRSSALSLGRHVVKAVRICYGFTAAGLAVAAMTAEVQPVFWLFWLVMAVQMQRSCRGLNGEKADMASFGQHFSQQVRLGTLLLIGLILSRALA